MVRIALALATAALILGACGDGDCSCARGPATPSPKLAEGFDVLVTERDQDVSMRVGQRIEVVLTQRSGMTAWGPIMADDTTVLEPVPTGITAARGVTVAGFAALKPGAATIRSTAGPQCSPGQACPMYAVLYSPRVTVT
jgi:hypothetical protein